MTRDQRLYFPSEGHHTHDFYALKKIHQPPTGFEPANLGSSGEYDNHGTTGVDYNFLINTVQTWTSKSKYNKSIKIQMYGNPIEGVKFCYHAPCT